MAYRAIALRLLRMTALLVLGLCILLIAFVQFQQRLLRYRAERLLADIHSVRLHQSTWNNAQTLMKRWGAWGHYEGTCSANDCRYAIELEDLGSRLLRTNADRLNFDLLERWSAFRIYQLVGGRFTSMGVEFIVQDGTIWRTSADIIIQVPPHASRGFAEYSLIVRTRSRQSLAAGPDNFASGSDEQLAQHPDYKIGRPGGCKICLMATVTYTPHLAQSEIQRLTAFDLSCLTRLHACTTLEEVLPAVRGLHLYPTTEPDYHPVEPPQTPPKTCDIPVWALGRDATFVLELEALSTKKEQAYGGNYEKAEVKVIASLKEQSPWPVGTVLTMTPYAANSRMPHSNRPSIWSGGSDTLCFCNLNFRNTSRTIERFHFVGVAYSTIRQRSCSNFKKDLPKMTSYAGPNARGVSSVSSRWNGNG